MSAAITPPVSSLSPANAVRSATTAGLCGQCKSVSEILQEGLMDVSTTSGGSGVISNGLLESTGSVSTLIDWSSGVKTRVATDFERVAAEIGALVSRKNAAYGDSCTAVDRMMLVLFPSGIPVAKYHDALLMVRVLDKLNRLANGNGDGGESPWDDVAGYGLRGAVDARKLAP